MTTLSEASRLARVETLVRQQGYLVWVLLVATILDTAFMLYHWQGQSDNPDFDHIAVALSAFQITFAVAALYGFWALRGLTRETAQDVAEIEVRRIAPSLVAREVESALSAMGSGVTISDDDVAKIVAALGEGEKRGQ